MTDKDSLMGSAFNSRYWRLLLDETCKEIDSSRIGLQVISPWGFELLGDLGFLSKKLRRFYCYIGVPKKSTVNLKKITHQFSQSLHNRLKMEDSNMANDVVLIIEQNKLIKLRSDNYICQPEDKLIDIQSRYVEKDILYDYAKYITLCVDSIVNLKGECRSINTSKMWRRRLYQLYIMIENIFGYLVPMDRKHSALMQSVPPLIDNSIQCFFTPEISNSAPSDIDKKILNQLIKPRTKMIQSALVSGSSEKIHLSCDAYHTEGKLELIINKCYYDQAINKIRITYLEYA